jgi:carbon starvation protein
VISSWGFVIAPELLTQTAQDVGELSILSRTGGAPTLAVGMAKIMADLFGSKAMMAFWYHFAILFEALFILTAIDAGTRVGRFMIQDLLGTFYAPLKQTRSWASNLIATTLCVSAWGYFLYQGVIDPLGGINTLWPLFGISNQMLAAIALTLATVVLFKMKRERYAWVTIAPAIWLVICTVTAGLQKLFHPDPAISFLASAQRFSDALAQGQVLAPAKSIAEMQRIIFNSYVDAGLCALFIAVVAAMVGYGLVAAWRGYVSPHITAREAPAHV